MLPAAWVGSRHLWYRGEVPIAREARRNPAFVCRVRSGRGAGVVQSTLYAHGRTHDFRCTWCVNTRRRTSSLTLNIVACRFRRVCRAHLPISIRCLLGESPGTGSTRGR